MRIGEVRLSDELGGGGLGLSSKIPNFSLLKCVDLLMQTGFKTALQKQIHDIDTDRSNMSRDHKSHNNLFNPNPLKVMYWCITTAICDRALIYITLLTM